MEVAQLIVNIVLGLAAIAVLVVYIYIAKLTRQQVAASQEQVQAAQALLELAQRPFLFPTGDHTVAAAGTMGWFSEIDDTAGAITLVNAGAGIALNIHGRLMPPLPKDEAGRKLRAYARSLVLRAPLRPGDQVRERSTASQPPFAWTTTLTTDPESTFAAPTRTPGIDLPVLGRLTLTFEDALGHTHGCQYDYVETGVKQGRWEFFRFYPHPEVREDIAALTRRLEIEFQTALHARPTVGNPIYGPEHIE